MASFGQQKFILIFIILFIMIFVSVCFGSDKKKHTDSIDYYNSAQQTENISKQEQSLPLQLSITTSGGVSLGGYQAGYLYYLTVVVKENPELFKVKLLTGSSAGSINSMIAIIALGKKLEKTVTKSPFFTSWTQISHEDLLDVNAAPPLALSSRKVLEDLASKLETLWNKGLDKSLDIVMGVTATRVKGRSVDVSTGFSVPRQEEKFIFRIRGRGENKEPSVKNYIDQTYGISHPILPFINPDTKTAKWTNFSIIKQLMFASSAFPLAFPPQKIGYCMTNPELNLTLNLEGGTFKDCPTPKYKSLFIDGSMFDRNPLHLAYRIAKSGMEIDPIHSHQWRAIPDIKNGVLPENFYFIYLDAEQSSYPEIDEEKPTKQVEALFPSFGAYSQGFVRSAQAKELYTLVDNNPDVKNRIDLTTRDLPTASGQLANFFGFFDSKFRIYDFYLGMHDARKYFEHNISKFLDPEKNKTIKIKYPEDNLSKAKSSSWAPYFCMRSSIDGISKHAKWCNQKNLQDFRILLQVSLDRLFDHCRKLPFDETVDHILCKRAMEGEFPPQIQKLAEDNDNLEYWQRLNNETEFQHTMRLLVEYEFLFEDLGLERDDAWLAMSKIRELLAGKLDDFAKKLPAGESIALRTLGKPALNFFMYQPPQAIIYLGGGKGAELGLSLAGGWTPSRWIRFNFALQIKGLFELLSPAPNMFDITPLFGIEIENVRLSTPMLQAKLGIRAGYQLSTADKFSGSLCNMDTFSLNARQCSAPVGQVMLVFTFYERIRIQGGVEWFPYFLPPMQEHDKNIWNGFIEIGWQWISPF